MKIRPVFRLAVIVVVVFAMATSVSGEPNTQTIGWWTLASPNLYPNSTSYNVGIGTTTPAAKLHVSGGGGGATDLRVTGRIHTGDAGNSGGVWLDNGKTMFVGQISSNVGFWTSGVGWNAFQITPGGTVNMGGNANIIGNVGIGTYSPASKFHTMWSNTNPNPGVRFADAGIFVTLLIGFQEVEVR